VYSSRGSSSVQRLGLALLALALPAVFLLVAPANAFEEVTSFGQDESYDTEGNLVVEASVIHVLECIDPGENGEEVYVYEYVNRPGFRAISPPDWGHALGGKDFDTYEEAALVACGGGSGGGGGGYVELYSFPQAAAPNVEASVIHVIQCDDSGGQFYIYEYVDRPGFRAILPPDWGHAIGGKDFDTYDEAAGAACGGGGGGPVVGAGYVGCFADAEARDLTGYGAPSDTNSPEECMETCYDLGFAYAGVQYSSWCFCGDSYGKLGPAENCDMTCVGDQDETCGGAWANEVWATGASAGESGGGHGD
jgi:hypothetical protein